MKYLRFLYASIKLRSLQTVLGLAFIAALLVLGAHYAPLVRTVLGPLKQVSGKVVAPVGVVHDDTGKTLSEADPATARGAGNLVKSIARVPVANAKVVGGISVPILMYHHVGPLPPDADSMRRDLTVSPHDFASQVQWLASHGYTSVTLEEVYLATQKKFTLPSKPVVFTFDDGYADVFIFAVPTLHTYDMVGSFAIVPGFLGTPEYGTWADVVSAKAQGMEILSHTENHFDGSSAKFDSVYIQHNLEQSLAELESRVGPIPRILVYPYGHFTPEYVEVAQRVGFTMALTTHFGMTVNPEDLMHTPRVRVHGAEQLDTFVEVLTGKKK